jgi:hypothetical protein
MIDDPGFHRMDDFQTGAALGPARWDESRILGCYIYPRPGDPMPLFGQCSHDPPGRVRVDLVGYAIVPLEIWNRQVDLAQTGAKAEATALLARVGGNPRPDASLRARIRAAWAILRGQP